MLRDLNMDLVLTRFLQNKILIDEDPKVFSGHINQAPIIDIIHHRNKTYVDHGFGYLVKDAIDEIDPLDARAFHIWAECDEKIVGSLRILTHPFEIQSVIKPQQTLIGNLNNHIEIGRLAINHRNPKIFERLMATACLHGIAHNHKGIVGMCRIAQKRLFERFGLEAVDNNPLMVPSRNNGRYWIMGADWHRLSGTLCKEHEKELNIF